MSKVKVNVKSNYSVKKMNKVMRMRSENFEPTNYEVFKVTGPNGFKKFFVSRKDATEYINQAVIVFIQQVIIQQYNVLAGEELFRFIGIGEAKG